MSSSAYWSTLRPPPLRTVSQWADAERVLTSESSAAPGAWRTDHTPYLREIMDRMSASDPCERVDVMMASQLGKTEAILNVIGYVATDCPGPILMVQPRDEDVRRYSRQRVAPMIRSSAALRGLFADARSRDGGSAMAMREFSGGSLIMASAGSAAGLASMPIRVVLLDEIDRYPESAGAEGDPVELAIQRTVNFARRKILCTSTPTVRDRSRIEAAMRETGWRVYETPCPHCGLFAAWEWENLRWEPGRPETAAMHCAGCGAATDERDKRELLALGRWRPLYPEREDGRRYGYHTSALIAPYGWRGSSWPALAARWEQSAKDSERRRVVVNTALARTYDESEMSTVDPESLQGRAEVYAAPCPEGVLLLTAGVDVQVDRIECDVWGWGVDEESWLIEHRAILGDPTTPAPWAALDDLLLGRWAHEAGGDVGIDAACVDSGSGWAQQVQAWCSRRRGRRIYATKGGADPARAVWPARASRGKGNKSVYILGVNAAKTTLWRQVQRPEPGPGYVHTPVGGPDAAWYGQLLGERPRTTGGHTTWHAASGQRVEALDCRNYAYAALCSMGSTSRTLTLAGRRLRGGGASASPPPPRPAPPVAAPTPSPPAAPPAPKPPRPRRQPGSWLDAGARIR
jgi:phage terminase large subunit GpA-like protein